MYHTGQVYLRRNLIGQPFPDLETYLDIQFRLLSEDFMFPTRQGLLKAFAGEIIGRGDGLRIYGKVVFQRGCGQVYHPSLVPERPSSWRLYHIEIQELPRVRNWNRRLINGSLVFLWDGANELLVATVIDGFRLYCSIGFPHPWTNLRNGNLTIALENRNLTPNFYKMGLKKV